MKRLNNLLSLHLQKILARDRGGGWPRAGSQLEPVVIGIELSFTIPLVLILVRFGQIQQLNFFQFF